MLLACGQQETPAPEAPDTAAPMATMPERIPITTVSEEARDLFDQGVDLTNNLQGLEARSYFEQAVEKDPDFAMAYVFLANTAQNAMQFHEASTAAEGLVDKVSPGEGLIIKAQAAGLRNDEAAQLDYLTQLVAMHPKDERSHLALANYHAGLREVDAAIEHYGHATTIKPDFAVAHNALGYALRANGQLDEAEEAFKTYRDLVPDEANPYDSYAELLMELGRYDESIENYQAALARDAGFISAHAGISVNHALKGDTDAALAAAAAMRAAARNTSEERNANFREATAHLFAGDVDAAIAAIQKNVTLSEAEGNHVALWNHHQYMGDIMLDAGDAEKALEHYETALEHGRQAEVNDALKAQGERTFVYRSALAAIIAEDADAAAARVADFKSQVEAAGGTALERFQVHAAAGLLALSQQDYATAVTELSQSDQTNPVVLYWLAMAHDGAGDPSAAAGLASKAASHNPLSPNAPFVRAEALELVNKLEG
jgi:tetratricopeptide (TPR) repeat protein